MCSAEVDDASCIKIPCSFRVTKASWEIIGGPSVEGRAERCWPEGTVCCWPTNVCRTFLCIHRMKIEGDHEHHMTGGRSQLGCEDVMQTESLSLRRHHLRAPGQKRSQMNCQVMLLSSYDTGKSPNATARDPLSRGGKPGWTEGCVHIICVTCFLSGLHFLLSLDNFFLRGDTQLGSVLLQLQIEPTFHHHW